MWQRMTRRPQLVLVAAGSVVVLVVAIIAPSIGAPRNTRAQSPAMAAGTSSPRAMPPRVRFPASPHVHTVWSDSTVFVEWDAIPGAAGYRASLIRASDMGIMEQIALSASQTMWDGQGVWPGEWYFVAIQPLRASGDPGPAIYSAVGQSVPISYATYNGFLDKESRKAGQIDTNLWDEHIFYSNVAMYGDAFVNNQLHYHLAAGCPVRTPCAGQQTITAQNARVPLDWASRTVTIHGEVDLKGDDHQWFGAVLSPQIVGADRVLDEVDRFFFPLTMPILELFTFQGHTRLLYAKGDGSPPQELASIPNPRGFNNVRDDIVWRVSATHTTVIIDGTTVFDLSWPAPLTFTHSYLSLFAEDYPNSGGTNGQPVCDQFPNDCSIWHLDNWGFDAPAGHTQPTTTAYYAAGCGPYAAVDPREGAAVEANDCGAINTNDTRGAATFTIPKVTTTQLTDAGVVFDAQRLHTQGALTVSVNGHTAHAIPYVATDHNTYNYQSYRVDVPASELVSGNNTVRFVLAGANGGDSVTIANVQIETTASTPHSPPAYPPEPAPIGTWTAGQ